MPGAAMPGPRGGTVSTDRLGQGRTCLSPTSGCNQEGYGGMLVGEGFVVMRPAALSTPTPGPVSSVMREEPVATPTATQTLPATPSAAVDLDASTPVPVMNLVSVVDPEVDASTPGPATKILRGSTMAPSSPAEGSEVPTMGTTVHRASYWVIGPRPCLRIAWWHRSSANYNMSRPLFHLAPDKVAKRF